MRISRRAIGWLLLTYGAVGILLVVLGGVVGLGVADRVERLTDDLDATLTAAARATDTAAEAFDDVDLSLAEARASADTAAALARDASGTLTSLATAMSLSLFGAQPLLPLADDFTTSADQAEELADTLDSVAGSLGETRTEVAEIGPQLGLLSDRLTDLGARTTDTGTPPPVRLLVIVLLAWVLMQAVGSAVAGLALIRPPADVSQPA